LLCLGKRKGKESDTGLLWSIMDPECKSPITIRSSRITVWAQLGNRKLHSQAMRVVGILG